jgi:two-component system LytT family response regulator
VHPIRTLVCDDEPMARDGVRALLARDPHVEVVGEAADGEEAVGLVARLRPDLLLLDVQMPALDGFGVLDALAARGATMLPTVVFVTAHDEYAVRAFEAHAVDYLLKPFSDARFEESLRRVKPLVWQRRQGGPGQPLDWVAARRTMDAEGGPGAPGGPPIPHRQRIAVRLGSTTRYVHVDDLDWIEADDYCVRLHAGGKSYLVRESLARLERTLEPARFIRVHRSAIIAIARINCLRTTRGATWIVLRDGTELPLSRSRRGAFERALGIRAPG